MKSIIKFLLVFTVIIVFIVYSCENKSAKTNDKGGIIVKLADETNVDTTLNIDLKAVQVKYKSDNNTEEYWYELTTKDSIYNLRKLQGDSPITIAKDELDVGKISQLRLLLGENNTIVIAEDTIDVEVPFDYIDGTSINISDSIIASKNLEILLNVDIKSSISGNEDGLFSLKPVVKIIGINVL